MAPLARRRRQQAKQRQTRQTTCPAQKLPLLYAAYAPPAPSLLFAAPSETRLGRAVQHAAWPKPSPRALTAAKPALQLTPFAQQSLSETPSAGDAHVFPSHRHDSADRTRCGHQRSKANQSGQTNKTRHHQKTDALRQSRGLPPRASQQRAHGRIANLVRCTSNHCKTCWSTYPKSSPDTLPRASLTCHKDHALLLFVHSYPRAPQHPSPSRRYCEQLPQHNAYATSPGPL